MKPIHRLHILPSLPPELSPLWDLTHNLWWTWSPQTIRTLQQIDPETWIASGRDPRRFLSLLKEDQLRTLVEDRGLSERIERVIQSYQRYRDSPSWFQENHAHSALQVAYFSAEFGLSEGLRIYSGGLGVLAGDHLKAASDLGLPLVGMGLLYREGYFRQALNIDGWQMERYPENDFYQMPIEPACSEDGQPVHVAVPFPTESCELACGKHTLAASPSTYSTPTCPKTIQPTEKSPHACTVETPPCAYGRRCC